MPSPGLLRTTRVHDRLTPRMIAAFFHTNFSLTKPRTTEVRRPPPIPGPSHARCTDTSWVPWLGTRLQMQHFLDNLPACLPGDDEMQVRPETANGLVVARQPHCCVHRVLTGSLVSLDLGTRLG